MAVTAERVETLKVTMEMRPDVYERHVERVKAVTGDQRRSWLEERDKMRVSYTFDLEYFNVERSLRAVREILADPDVLVDVGLKVERVRVGLQEQESLLVAMLDDLRAVQRQIASRT